MMRKELEKLLKDNFSEDEEVVFGYHDGFYGAHYSFGCRMECEDGAKAIILEDGGTGFEEEDGED